MFRIVCGLLLATATGAQSNLPKFLWREPRPMTTQDWTCGPGGCDNTPAPPFKFKKEDRSGSTAKIELTDSRGREWSLKFGSEVIPECFGSRFLTAIGYLAEPTYFVDSGKIENTPKLYRARFFVRPDGTFHRARFELRGQPDLKFKSDQTWAWNDNPFRGTRELAGLKIVMMLLSNWDAKDARNPGDSNAGVFQLPDALGYSVFDWGASL